MSGIPSNPRDTAYVAEKLAPRCYRGWLLWLAGVLALTLCAHPTAAQNTPWRQAIAEPQQREHDLRRLPPISLTAQVAGKPDIPFSASTPPLADQTSMAERLKALEQEVQSLRSTVEEQATQQQEAHKDKTEKDEKEQPKKPSAETPSIRFTMQLQADAYTFDQNEANVESVGPIDNGTAFRRARVGWLGDWKQTEYRIEFDFALPGRPTFLDVWGGLKEVPILQSIRVGHFFEPFSLERLTPNRYMTFMERSLPDAPFAPARNLGIATFGNSEDERMTWAIGLFSENSNFFGEDVGMRLGTAATGRITFLPYWDEQCDGRHYVHLGIAGSIRKPSRQRAIFATQPEARLGSAIPNVPPFVDTGFFAAERTALLGTEAAWIAGAFSLQSEFMYDFVDRPDANNVGFHGWYVIGSWFLTGEHRPYRRKMPQGGVFDRVKPFKNFFLADHDSDGLGAWEIACRLSHIDLNDYDIQGGRLTDFTVGLNWYLTPYLRMTTNYVRANLNDPTVGPSYANIFGIRMGYEF